MNRFVGLSLMCLMFLSARAESNQGESEFRGSSWSLQMSQNNDEPIKVKSERKEYDKTGVTLHRRSQGIIENGVYKSISEQDLNEPSQVGTRGIGNAPQMKHNPRGIFDFKRGENMPQMRQHPRRYGKNLHKDFGKRFRNDFGNQHGESFGEDFDKNKLIIIHPQEIFDFGDTENMPKAKRLPMERWGAHHPRKFSERSRHHPQEFVRKNHHHPRFAEQTADQTSDKMEDRLKNRSRVSFYRPVERLFEKLFGLKKQDNENITDLDKQNRAESEEVWKDMREFEDGFFDNEYFDAEE